MHEVTAKAGEQVTGGAASPDRGLNGHPEPPSAVPARCHNPIGAHIQSQKLATLRAVGVLVHL